MSALVAAALNRRQIGMSPVSRKTRMSRHMDHDMISLHKGQAGIGSHTNRSAPSSSSSFSSSALFDRSLPNQAPCQRWVHPPEFQIGTKPGRYC